MLQHSQKAAFCQKLTQAVNTTPTEVSDSKQPLLFHRQLDVWGWDKKLETTKEVRDKGKSTDKHQSICYNQQHSWHQQHHSPSSSSAAAAAAIQHLLTKSSQRLYISMKPNCGKNTTFCTTEVHSISHVHIALLPVHWNKGGTAVELPLFWC